MALSAAATSLIGVAIGGTIGIVASFLPHVYDRRAAKLSARAITRAYIAGILRIEEIRQHANLYRQNVAALKSGATANLMTIFGAADDVEPDRDIQKEIISQLGFLPADDARDVMIFGNMLGGLRADLKAMAGGQMNSLPITEKVRILEADLKLWEDALVLGRDLIGRL